MTSINTTQVSMSSPIGKGLLAIAAFTRLIPNLRWGTGMLLSASEYVGRP